MLLKVWLLSWTVRETVVEKVLILDIFLFDTRVNFLAN